MKKLILLFLFIPSICFGGRYFETLFATRSDSEFDVGNYGNGTTEKIGNNVEISCRNTWTQVVDFSGTARHGVVSFVIGDTGYVGTGHDGAYKKDFYAYNPATDTWTQVADFPGTARRIAVSFVIENIGYEIGRAHV